MCEQSNTWCLDVLYSQYSEIFYEILFNKGESPSFMISVREYTPTEKIKRNPAPLEVEDILIYIKNIKKFFKKCLTKKYKRGIILLHLSKGIKFAGVAQW